MSVQPYNSRQVGNFLFVRVVAKTGETIAGERVNEDTFSIQLRDMTGRTHSFLKSEVAAVHKDWGWSPMPAAGAVLSNDEVVDVVAFLTSLKGEP